MGNFEVSFHVFQALSHPCRRSIVEMLSGEREATVGEISRRFEMTRPAVAKHLARLRLAGLVTESWRGREHVYRSKPETLRVVFEWLHRVGAAPSMVGGDRIEEEEGERRQGSRSRDPEGVVDRMAARQESLPHVQPKVEALDRETESEKTESGEIGVGDTEQVETREIQTGEIEWQVW